MTSRGRPGGKPGPGVRQEIDEQPLAGRHGVHRHLARERDADALAVGIAARGAHIAGGVALMRSIEMSTGRGKVMVRMLLATRTCASISSANWKTSRA